MSVVLTVFIILASLLMIGIVLVQKSKGGGLASNFASSNQIMGVRKTTDFVEKATWTLAIVIMVLYSLDRDRLFSVERQDMDLSRAREPALRLNRSVLLFAGCLYSPIERVYCLK